MKKCDGREFIRAKLTQESAYHFLHQAEYIKTNQFHSDLVINFDESEVVKRFLMWKTKNCVYLKNSLIQPRFLEEVDIHHASIAAGITLSGGSLIQLLISTRITFPEELKTASFWSNFRYIQKTRYLNERVMLFLGYWSLASLY